MQKAEKETSAWTSPPPLFRRRRTRTVELGSLKIGGDHPVSLQSMTNTDTRRPDETVAQIERLAAVGCQLARIAVPDQEAARALPRIVAASPLPLVADIHFDPKLGLAAIDAGMPGLRINPGTIRDRRQRQAIARAAAAARVVVRIGINGGSLEPSILEKFGGQAGAAALVASALDHCAAFEDWGCPALKVSLKSSSVACTVEAYRRFAAATDYPLHLGLTEAGLPEAGAVKSAVALGTLLMEGIGDTIRVSLTGDPVEEIRVGRRILAAAGRRRERPDIIACPTCGRTEIDLLSLVREVDAEVRSLEEAGLRVDLDKIAVMGCIVNGPGEAGDADLGVAGGCGKGALFRNGEVVATLPWEELKERFLAEIRARASGNRRCAMEKDRPLPEATRAGETGSRPQADPAAY